MTEIKPNQNKAVGIRTMRIVRQGFVCKQRFFNLLIQCTYSSSFFLVIHGKWRQKMPNRLSISWIGTLKKERKRGKKGKERMRCARK